MKKWLVPTAVLASIFAAAAPAAAAPSGPPITVDGPATFTSCGFPVTGEVTGKVKNITTPSGDVISTSPGLKVTLTGPDGKTASYVITGVLFFSFPGDRIEVKATGVNLLQLPGDDGLILTKGNVNFALELDGVTELRRFSGPGTATNICSLLAPDA
ncbi:hypothetical protein ASF98_03435 [Arthrobacter sp. Leaf337]|uniref:hypothetical protein n=1 Tax=Arthrobacter sp. Leaf337 TaxID=1736342 RepID=UPI0006F62218|nr:hypothetical protein [Arthrobacter sp. Leaf337]KQR74923.1 hypothetical protein ASF98_03435 [Arthrobacter sp. Leaf337]